MLPLHRHVGIPQQKQATRLHMHPAMHFNETIMPIERSRQQSVLHKQLLGCII